MKILLGTDGSEGASMAGRLLAALPLPAGTQVTALGAAPEPAWLTPSPHGRRGAAYPWLRDLFREEERAARCASEETVAPLRERGVDVTVCVRRQRPAEAILEQAEADGSDLIVLGSRGQGTMERLLIGSVSEKVARYARCSVLVARGETIQRVMVAVNGSESSEQALGALLRLPLSPHAEIRVVHIAPAEGAGRTGIVSGVDMEMAIEEYDRACHANTGPDVVRCAVERLGAAGRATSTEARRGAPAEELVAAAREWGADLLVVGSENPSVLGKRFLGSVSSRVLSHAPCSVLVGRTSHNPSGA
jgi:nucleotide-binding universal stress UspA family protein